jgi:glutamate-1-semialdehyde 2,1-aminomutase
MICNEGYGAGSSLSYISRAQGCRVWDGAGRAMIDMALGGGSMILGHAHPAVAEAIARQARDGAIYTAPHAAVHEMDGMLDRFIPWLPGRVWCNSGSEAVMRLVRIARAVTGKRKIGLFSGCWHGSWDGTLVEEDYDGDNVVDRPVLCRPGCPRLRLRSAGTPLETLDSILFLPYRDSSALSLIREYADKLACVLVEPVQGSNPSADVGPFLDSLRHTCSSCGVLLAFDEVVTGFRLSPGGGQERFGVQGDLAAYGKIIGGGLPVGLVAGTGQVMDEARRMGVFFGGTFSANPLVVAAGRATLARLGLEVYAAIHRMGEGLRDAVNNVATRFGLPLHMMGCGSINRLILSPTRVTSRRHRDSVEPPPTVQRQYYDRVRVGGVHIGTNRILFLSTAHGIDELVRVMEALCAWKGE